MDSGASTHICYNAAAFISFHPIHTASVILPNNASIPVKFMGDIRLNSRLTLHRVLYVPQFNFNLLSVSALTNDSGLAVHFYHGSFNIQDT